MPLFIDLHIDEKLTPETVRQCHVADKAIQAKYGVQYLQVLLNQPQGYLFCLVEAPDKESCAKVHQEAHGNIACNILEITESDFSALIGNRQKDSFDFIRNVDGSFDSGVRTILAVHTLGAGGNNRSVREMVRTEFARIGIRSTENAGNGLMFLFDSCTEAIDAGKTLLRKAKEYHTTELRLGIAMGMPLGKDGDFFEEAMKMAHIFSFVSANGQITVSAQTLMRYQGVADDTIKVITPADEKFITRALQCVERCVSDGGLEVDCFAKELGISRSQLGRRLSGIINLSPNDFIKEFRLRKSVSLMEEHDMNVTEVSMAVGFNNPSYFARCFQIRFGKTPSEYFYNT